MTARIIIGDCREVLRTLPDESVHCVVTSPPYFGLRDYGMAGQLGQEPTPADFVAVMVEVFREVRRVLRADGTLWLNLGDSYNNNPSTSLLSRAEQGNGSGSFQIPPEKHAQARRAKPNKAQPLIDMGIKKKDLIGIPWRLAFALQADGWWLRSDIIWSKPNPMPESVTDRPTRAHEYIFLLTKSERYFYDAEAIKEPCSENSHGSPNVNPGTKNVIRDDGGSLGKWTNADRAAGRNKRSVWEIPTQGFSEAHFATFPPALIEPCIKAGCPVGGTVLDPFGGAGTTGLVADRLGRNSILIELNPEYAAMAERRIKDDAPLFAKVAAE